MLPQTHIYTGLFSYFSVEKIYFHWTSFSTLQAQVSWHRNYISVESNFFLWRFTRKSSVNYLPVGFLNFLESTFAELNIISYVLFIIVCSILWFCCKVLNLPGQVFFFSSNFSFYQKRHYYQCIFINKGLELFSLRVTHPGA